MSSPTLPTLKFLLCSTLGLSMFLGNSIAFAQVNPDVVVPTTSTPGNTNQNRNPNTNPNINRNTNSNVTRTRVSNTRNGNSTSTVTTSTSSSNNNSFDSGKRFGCLFYNNQYTVMYQPESQPGKYFAWATPRTLGGDWDANKRCLTIADRLESYRPDGLLELRNATLNGYNTLCVTTEKNKDCRLILTVPPGQDPFATRNQIFSNLTTADSGQETIGVNTYTNNGSQIDDLIKTGQGIFGRRSRRAASSPVSKDAINLQNFLDQNDGGNARHMRDGVTIRNESTPASSGLQLNPKKFR